jgi:hypothetical protein
MSNLGGNLRLAAEYAVAKTVAVGLISCDDAAVQAIAREVTATVLDELASREEHIREVSPRNEQTTTKDECSARILDYRTAINDLRAEAKS